MTDSRLPERLLPQTATVGDDGWLRVGGLSATSKGVHGLSALQSVGALTFGPNGILFVGDSMGGKIYALDTEDRTASQGANL